MDISPFVPLDAERSAFDRVGDALWAGGNTVAGDDGFGGVPGPSESLARRLPSITAVMAHAKAPAIHLAGALSCCALGRIRTCNLLIRSQMLYPLSYERPAPGAVVRGQHYMTRPSW